MSLDEIRALPLDERALLTPDAWAHLGRGDRQMAQVMVEAAKRQMAMAEDRRVVRGAAKRVRPGTEAHYQCGVMCRTFRHGSELERRQFADLRADHTDTDAHDRWLKTASALRAIQQTMVSVWGIEHLREREEGDGDRQVDLSGHATEDLEAAVVGLAPSDWQAADGD